MPGTQVPGTLPFQGSFFLPENLYGGEIHYSSRVISEKRLFHRNEKRLFYKSEKKAFPQEPAEMPSHSSS